MHLDSDTVVAGLTAEAPASVAVLAAVNCSTTAESAVAMDAAIAFSWEQIQSLTDDELVLLGEWAQTSDGRSVSGMTDEARRKEVEFNRGRLFQ